ncbi:MAG TPA: ISL3 family transposase [bacterium]|nr:ISL3 family transposase [bacterium]
MPRDHSTNILAGWERYRVKLVERNEPAAPGGKPRVEITLVRERRTFQCSGCGQETAKVHETVVRCVRDLPILDAETYVWVPRYRVACPTCGPKLESLPWLSPWDRVTKRLAENVVRLCRVLPVKQVAEFYGLDWDTVKHLDVAALAEQLLPVDLSRVTVIAMDEFAVRKGHRYATVVLEPHRKRILWVGNGHSRDAVHPFFELLGDEGCARLEAVVMDMSAAYEEEVRTHCRNAVIVYDLFHVVAKYGREVIDRVRVDEANRVRQDKAARKVIKGARWLLLRNRENVTADDRVRLQELLAVNRRLAAVYLLKDDLKHLWDYTYPGAAMRFFAGWYQRAIRSRIKPLKAFARQLKVRLPGIVAHCTFPLHTSILEGITNKIKVLKRMGYGYRDDGYFFLKIMAAFPGIPENA